MAKKLAGRKRALIAAGFLTPGALAASLVAAGSATAAGIPLQVALSACGTGSSAVWSSAGLPVLTAGTAGGGTCGAPATATYNPAYAKVDFTGSHDGAVPTTEPEFQASAYSSGTPRMVIELNNGHSLVGYPGLTLSGGTGPDAAGMAWAADNGNTYTGWTTAANAALAYSTTVKDAYIVEDASQPTGTANTLSGVQYGGQVIGSAGAGFVEPASITPLFIGKPLGTMPFLVQTSSSDPAEQVTVSGLPGGLSYKVLAQTSQGTPFDISGTPAAGDALGLVYAVVTMTNAYGGVSTEKILFQVEPALPPVPVLSHVHAAANGLTREVISWQASAKSWIKTVIIGPGGINHHVGWVPPGTTKAYYSGLEAHHGYTVTLTPYTAKNGFPIGTAKTASVWFVS